MAAQMQDWMSTLPAEVRRLPIINLAIPGSHNSMTYGINRHSQLAPDATRATRCLYRLVPWLVRRWARTQTSRAGDQLRLGVRYLDLRIGRKDDRLFYVHGIYANEIEDPIPEILEFLFAFPREVIVLDLQHFYAMEVHHHLELHARLIAIFGDLLYTTADGSLGDCTLEACARLGRQVIIVYRRCPCPLPYQFWPSAAWPTPWPNVASVKRLETFLEDSLLTRKPQQGYVTQCILTPTPRYIVLRFPSSLRRTAKVVDKKLEPWIAEQSPGPFGDKEPPKVNVFIADFVDLKCGFFCQRIIELNRKLCPPSFFDAPGDEPPICYSY